MDPVRRDRVQVVLAVRLRSRFRLDGLLEVVGVHGVGSVVVSRVLLKVIDAVMGLRLTEEAEVNGLDSVDHSETAYNQ